ncbi:60S ribosomal protein L11 [Anaeramoeba flamelloides]|uniref:60S ribosomal protein L11 n=1 Tax=Anaeramoeba flamelloides TaxID=1746091 RepID=A0AAV7Z361_9EUKA|nr:60S ribosomal protein L11 [Anaeramoeba flamelloides]
MIDKEQEEIKKTNFMEEIQIVPKLDQPFCDFGLRRNEKIATHVKVRGKKAQEILERGIIAKEFELCKGWFPKTGIFGHGIEEHIDLGMRYYPNVGIPVMGFYVILKRPDDRVAEKKRRKAAVGKNHKVNKEDATKWFETKFEGYLID